MDNSETLEKIIKRPEVNLKEMLEKIEKPDGDFIDDLFSDQKALEQVEIQIKYNGYIKRQEELIAKMEKLEKINIPLNFDYTNIKTISTEGREKLSLVKPRSIGQAARISGVTPSDISVLLVYLRN